MTAGRRHLLAVVTGAYAAALAAALATGLLLAGRHPLLVTAAADVAATLVVFAASVAWNNSSIYDPYWSVAPVPIAAFWLSVAAPGTDGGRQALAAALVAAWAVRLTWNCLARWRSLAHEDFRYVEIRQRAGRLHWPASLLGIHLFPTAWVLLGLLPLWPALARSARPLGALDLAGAAVAGGAIALETLADLQLRRFLAARRDPAEVLEAGVWAWSRHPNYMGEILFWWGLWLLGLAADPSWWWTVAGPVAITALFTFVSAPWMDRRMEARHPGYAARRAAVPALWPWPRPGRRARA